LINVFVVVAVGRFLTYVTLDRYRQLRSELEADMARLESRLGSEVAGLDGRRQSGLAEVKGEIVRLEDRMDAGFTGVRSDLTSVALAVGAAAPRAPREAGQG